MIKKSKMFYVVLVILVLLTGYFFWPTTYKEGNSNQDIIIHKYWNGISYDYHLNNEEASALIKILKKSKFYHGVFRPGRMVGDKLIDFRIPGSVSPIIMIYYDTNKTYVFANISNKLILNDYYRISNKNDIRFFIENIIDAKATEFENISTNWNNVKSETRYSRRVWGH